MRRCKEEKSSARKRSNRATGKIHCESGTHVLALEDPEARGGHAACARASASGLLTAALAGNCEWTRAGACPCGGVDSAATEWTSEVGPVQPAAHAAVVLSPLGEYTAESPSTDVPLSLAAEADESAS